MQTNSYTTSIQVPQTPAIVFQKICDVPKWWNKDYEGSSTNQGDEFTVFHPGLHHSKQKLAEVIPNKKIVWLVTESKLTWLTNDPYEWTNTKMIFELTTNNDGTLLHFTHEGLVPEKECYTRCRQGWDTVIKERLFNFITTGKEYSNSQ